MYFDAPWSTSLKWTSGVMTVLLVVISTISASLGDGLGAIRLLVVGGPLLILVGALLFTIRAYELCRDGLKVERLLWTTSVPLTDLRAAWADPKAMKKAIRLFGNGGMYSFSGLFRNRPLGNFRAFATDHSNSVVLDLGRRKIVVTPESPDRFLRALRELWPTVGDRPRDQD